MIASRSYRCVLPLSATCCSIGMCNGMIHRIPPQVLNTRKPIGCLAWNQKQTILGIGQSPTMQFYKMIEPLQLVAYRRIRQREINIGGDCMPLPVDLKPDISHRIGSRLLAKTLLKQCSHKPDWDVLKACQPLVCCQTHLVWTIPQSFVLCAESTD